MPGREQRQPGRLGVTPGNVLQTEVRRALAGRLPARDPSRTPSVLGAGSDDVEAGRTLLHTLADGGWAVPHWPLDHGGMGLDQDGVEAVRSVLAKFSLPDLYPYLVGLELVGPTIMAHGNDEQRDRWLPSLKDGSDIWCQMFSEPDAGSDLANVKTRATPKDGGWMINGAKVWTSRAHYADRALLLARTDPGVPKHHGITAFGLDMHSSGVQVRPLMQMNGDTHFNEVFLDDVWVPDSDRVGEPGEGWRVALTCLSFERGSLAGDQGITVDRLINLGRETGAAARPVARDRLIRAIIEVRVREMSALRAAASRRDGHSPGPEGSAAKIATTRMVKVVAELASELKGPAAGIFADDRADEWQTMFLVAPSLSIRGGTDEIQHNILGERLLGLPPEPRTDKVRPFNERPDR